MTPAVRLWIALSAVVVTAMSAPTTTTTSTTESGSNHPLLAPRDRVTCKSPLKVCCTDNPVDIYFLLDCSSSIWIVDYRKQLQFVVNLVKHFDIQPTATRVGLGVFSNDYQPVIELGQYSNMVQLERAILATPYLTGNSYTEKGIFGMRTRGFRNARQNVTKVGVVVTDGKSQSRTATLSEARQAKADKVWVFTIGVGADVDETELAAIASEPSREFRHLVASFDILDTLAETLAVSTCSLNAPQADSAVCGQKNKADIMFVYNAAAMSAYNVDKVKDFLRFTVNEFSMTSGNVRAGVMSQGCNGGDILLSEYLRREDFLRALEGVPRAPTYAGLLKKLRNIGFDSRRGARQDAVKMAVLFVDDVMTVGDDASYEALLLKYDDVLIHVVAIGSQYKETEVTNLATSASFVTKFPSFDELHNSTRRTHFLQTFCKHL